MLTRSSEGYWFDSRVPGFQTQMHVTPSLSTEGSPVSCVPLSEGGFQVGYPLACAPGYPEFSKSYSNMATLLLAFTFTNIQQRCL